MAQKRNSMNVNRPAPVEKVDGTVSSKADFSEAADALISGQYLVVEDQYPTGTKLLAALRKEIVGDSKKESFKRYREKRSLFHEVSNRLLAPVKDHALDLKKAPDIGWLKILYPDLKEFYLPFPQVQGLNSAWQWYKNGVDYPMLREKLHPWYGAYFPTRNDHLYLFDYWLKKFRGEKSGVLDLGVGSGVLTFQLLERGAGHVTATDINPNALKSVEENAKRMGLEEQVTTLFSDLFEHIENQFDIIVFNPPWLPSNKEISGLDEAIYYQPGLFSRFFEQAADHIKADGRIVMLYSNFAQNAGLIDENPIEEELSGNSRYEKVKLIKRKVLQASGKTRRPDHRGEEFVELWELKLGTGETKQ